MKEGTKDMSEKVKVIKSSKEGAIESTSIDNAYEEYLMSRGIASTLASQRLKELCVELDLLKGSKDLFNTVKLGRDQQVLLILKDVFDVLKVPVTLLKMGTKYALQYDDFLLAVLPVDVSGITMLEKCSIGLGTMKRIEDYASKRDLICLTIVYLYDSLTGEVEVGVLSNDMLKPVSTTKICYGNRDDVLPDVYKLAGTGRPVVNIRSATVWDTIKQTMIDTPMTSELRVVISSSKIQVKEKWVVNQVREEGTKDGEDL